MTENEIQEHLFSWLLDKKQTLITPNVYLFQGESDLVSVSKAGFTSEYEIKISLDDYRRDFRDKKLKHMSLRDGKAFARTIPNYFYFVFPQSLYESRHSTIDIPDYAGVIVVSDKGVVTTKKRCKRLHGNRVSDRNLAYLGRGLMLRYWSMRTA